MAGRAPAALLAQLLLVLTLGLALLPPTHPRPREGGHLCPSPSRSSTSATSEHLNRTLKRIARRVRNLDQETGLALR